MFDDPADHHKRKAAQYLRDVDDMFCFDVTSGIYKLKSYGEKQNRNFWREAFPKWLTILISAVTLYFLIRYTDYARRQWIETAKSVEKTGQAVTIADRAATIAAESLQSSQKLFQIAQRPYVVVDENSPSFVDIPPSPKKPVMANIHLKNIGKAPAIEVINQEHFFPQRAKILSEVSPKEGMEESRKWVLLLNSKFDEMHRIDKEIRKNFKIFEEYSAGQDVAPSQRPHYSPRILQYER